MHKPIVIDNYATMKNFSLLKEYIRCLLTEDTPGGGLTDLGALRRVDEREFFAKIKSALSSSDGDVERAAKQLDIAASTLYLYIQQNPSLQSAKETSEKDEK